MENDDRSPLERAADVWMYQNMERFDTIETLKKARGAYIEGCMELVDRLKSWTKRQRENDIPEGVNPLIHIIQVYIGEYK